MAESFKHMATCACGAVGDIVDQSGPFDFKPWFVIEHQGGTLHRVVRVKVGDKFRFKEADNARR